MSPAIWTLLSQIGEKVLLAWETGLSRPPCGLRAAAAAAAAAANVGISVWWTSEKILFGLVLRAAERVAAEKEKHAIRPAPCTLRAGMPSNFGADLCDSTILAHPPAAWQKVRHRRAHTYSILPPPHRRPSRPAQTHTCQHQTPAFSKRSQLPLFCHLPCAFRRVLEARRREQSASRTPWLSDPPHADYIILPLVYPSAQLCSPIPRPRFSVDRACNATVCETPTRFRPSPSTRPSATPPRIPPQPRRPQSGTPDSRDTRLARTWPRPTCPLVGSYTTSTRHPLSCRRHLRPSLTIPPWRGRSGPLEPLESHQFLRRCKPSPSTHCAIGSITTALYAVATLTTSMGSPASTRSSS